MLVLDWCSGNRLKFGKCGGDVKAICRNNIQSFEQKIWYATAQIVDYEGSSFIQGSEEEAGTKRLQRVPI